MSIGWGTQYAKLKTNLRLAINRLKLVEKKKTEQAQKARKEIADFITAHKEDRARIRVEHIIREDYLVEAYELLEMYCDLLLARFGLIQQMKAIDEGIEEAVQSVLWAGPRVATDISEFKIISDQLTLKYGKVYAEACRSNQLGKVSPKLMAKLSVHAPPKILVEKYMIEIAKSQGVSFTPDVNIMREDELAAAEAMLIDFQNQGQRGYGWMYPPGTGDGAAGPPPNPGDGGYYPGPPPGPPPNPPGFGGGASGGGGGGGGNAPPLIRPDASQGQGGQQAFNYPSLKEFSHSAHSDDPGPIVKVPINPNPGQASAPPATGDPEKPGAGGFPMLSLPNLPEPPTDFPDENQYPTPPDDTYRPPPGPGDNNRGQHPDPKSGSNDDLDFDSLSKRFENLKKK